METFIVLGLCFVLYEALDLFQGCYHRQQQLQQQTPLLQCDDDDNDTVDLNNVITVENNINVVKDLKTFMIDKNSNILIENIDNNNDKIFSIS